MSSRPAASSACSSKLQQDYDSQQLLTPKSLALSLSPPRAPPVGTVHHALLLAQDPSNAHSWAIHHNDHEPAAHARVAHDTLRQRLWQRLHETHNTTQLDTRRRHHLPHPHLPVGPELSDQLTRWLGVWLPLSWQNACRDSGTFRRLADGMVTASVPLLALTAPTAVRRFVRLSQRRQRLEYGFHARHFIDIFLPDSDTPPDRLIIFVHGGAWGSGYPWMYRLVADVFVNNNMTVAILGYRTYPDANASGQVDDCQQAIQALASKFGNELSVTLLGHSSGAHVALLLLVDRAIRQATNNNNESNHSNDLNIDSFVGLSGPYDISHHFDYEASRGVEELSPMKPACGYSRTAFLHWSPAVRLQASLCDVIQLPPLLLLHGMQDDVVPFTATGEAARILKSCGVIRCDEIYVVDTGHQDTVMHMMLGGRTRDAVVDWIQQLPGDGDAVTSSRPKLLATSKL